MLDYDHAPLGDVAFRATSPELYASSASLRTMAMDVNDEDRARLMFATAQWYEDLALDLAEIRALPETPSVVVGDDGFARFNDDDIPF